MSDKTHIEWTATIHPDGSKTAGATWNPITGCSVHSAGCRNCYAMKLAGTRLRHHWSRIDLTRETAAGPVWNGRVRFNEAWLDQPLRWNRARRIFVCAHSDLFHENVPDEWIDSIFAVMALATHHTFQVLTKRAERMHDYLCSSETTARISIRLSQIGEKFGLTRAVVKAAIDRLFAGPLVNVWLMVSAEDQKTADERIPHLILTPAAVRGVSCEPLLDSIDLSQACTLARWLDSNLEWVSGTPAKLDWIIVGGESGQRARPTSPDDAMSLRDQSRRFGIAYFFKQWGEWIPMLGHDGGVKVKDKIILRDGWVMGRAGKKAAGRRLEGKLYSEFPRAA